MSTTSNQPWWEESKGEAHARVFATFEHLDNIQSHHRIANLHHLRLYSNRIAAGMGGRDYAVQESGEKLKLNIVKTVIDAATAQIATNRPRPMYLTERGNAELKTRAKRLSKFVMGQFYALDQYDLSLDVFRDACIFGTGYEKIYEVGGRICAERVFPNEILVDDHEAKYGEPQQLFQHKQVNREVLASAYKKHRAEIALASLVREDSLYSESIADPVSVIEAWHLPSAPGAKDGRHVICTSNVTLVDKPWESDRFPFAVFRWSKAPLGFLGIGISEELTPIQVEINFLLQKAQVIMNALTNSVWVKKGEIDGRISNKMNSVNTYKNTPPVALTLGGVPPEILQQIEALYRKAFEIVGISQLQAQSQKPAGLNSGEALKTYNDIGSQRFQHVGQRWEHFHVRQVAELILDRAREIEERGDGDLRVLAQGDRDVEEIRFSDVYIERDKYVTKVWPVSLFPDTPAGKLDTIEKLAGVSPEIQRYIMPLLDFPDLDAIRARVSAPYDIVEKMIEAMLERGQPQTPLPYMDFGLARNMGTLALLQAEKENVPEERKELLRVWLDKIDDMQALEATPPPAPNQPAVPGPAQPPDPMAAGPLPPGMPPPGMPPMM